MFGALKKKLQEALAKVTGKIEPSEPVKEEAKKPEKAVESRPVERLEEEIEAHIEELEVIEEKVHEEHVKETQDLREEERAFKEVKKEEEANEAAAQERELAARRAERAREEKPAEKIVEERVEAKPEEKRGLFKKIVEKTLSESEIEVILKELELALLESDVAVEVAERIGEDVKAALLGKAVRRGKTEDVIRTALRDAVLDILSQETVDIEKRIRDKDGPFLIMFIGFNGSGKTTSLAKFAHRLKHFKPVLAAGDTFRAASIEQLEEHSRRIGVEVVKHRYGADSAAVIFDAVKHARAVGSKLVLADTAGRSHSNANLMDELKKIVRVNKPDMKVLILDALAGNDIYDQARLFDQAVGVDAVVLTKADVYEKGGAALSAAYTLNKPILFLGVGQEYKDLQPFDPQKIAENLVGD